MSNAKFINKMGKVFIIETPVGDLEWVIVNGEGKLNTLNDKLYYQATLVLEDDEACKALRAEIDQFFVDNATDKQKKKNKKSTGYAPHKVKTGEDEDGDAVYEETGKWAFMFKTETTWADGKPKKVGLFNKKGAAVSIGDRKIGNGSRGRLKGVINIYDQAKDAGTSLWLNSIQLTKFVEYSQDQGFDAVDTDDADDDFEGFDETLDPVSDTPAEKPAEKAGKATPRL